MYKFEINEVSVNTAAGKKQIIPKSINVIVGPNNSGKSRLLKELRDYLSGDREELKILNEVQYTFPQSFEELDESYNVTDKMVKNQYGSWILKTYENKPDQNLDMSSSLESYYTRSSRSMGGEWRDYFKNIIKKKNYNEFFAWYGSLFYQYLGTEEKLTICKTQKNYGFNNDSINYLSSFKFEEELLDDLAEKVKKLFGKDIILDAQTLGDCLAFRIGENFDDVRNNGVRNRNSASRLFEERKLDDQGDGLKSFVSTYLSLKYNDSNILLLDEPEAFLHPPLARQTGEMIGEHGESGKTIFVATHSVEILKGILSKNKNVNVIRITQPKENINEINILDPKVLEEIMTDPLLRVSRVLEGVFCERVVITEAEADELVYQELIEKVFPESGLFFAHGQNKQTLAPIAKLYQKIGIQYEIITDFDVIRDPAELSEFLKLMPIDKRKKDRIINYATKLREFVNQSVNTQGLTKKEIEEQQKRKRNEVYHKEGIRFFKSAVQIKIKETLDIFSTFHLHVLQTGELETLLEEYGVEVKKKKVWIVDAIKKIAMLNREDIAPESNLYKFLQKVVEVKAIDEQLEKHRD